MSSVSIPPKNNFLLHNNAHAPDFHWNLKISPKK
jgi:hypothetical protein